MEANAGQYIKKYLYLKRFPCISLRCKLVPVQFQLQTLRKNFEQIWLQTTSEQLRIYNLGQNKMKN